MTRTDPPSPPPAPDGAQAALGAAVLVLLPTELLARALAASAIWSWHLAGPTGVALGGWRALGLVLLAEVAVPRTVGRTTELAEYVGHLFGRLLWVAVCVALAWAVRP